MHIPSWQNKRIIISGSGGFVGSHLVDYFRKKEANVVGLSRNPGSREERKVDLIDYDRLLSVVKDVQPDAFFHLAGEAIVEIGQTDPYRTFRNNIIGTLNVLETCRILQIPRIVIASTVHVYGDAPSPYREDEPARPSRPYETSKTSTDLIAQSYADTFNLPVLIPRFVNIYGPGDMNKTRIIPKTVSAVLNGEEPTLWGGRATRDYLYIDDALRAYDLLGKISDTQIERNRIFNFATGKSVTAKQLMEAIITLTKSPSKIRKVKEGRESELIRQDVSWLKARSILGWTPKVNLESGLQKTIEWYRSHPLSR